MNFGSDVNNHNKWWILYFENAHVHYQLRKSTQMIYYKTVLKILNIINVIKNEHK